MNQLRTWITRSFWTGAALTLLALLSLLTAAVLVALGDRPAAAGVWGVLAVTLVAWLFNFITLVGLLAWQTMHVGDRQMSQQTGEPEGVSSRTTQDSSRSGG